MERIGDNGMTEKSSSPLFYKIGKWVVDKELLDAYVDHIWKRNCLQDDRDISVKENERAELHQRVVQSAYPEIEDFDLDFQDALDEILDERCGLRDPTMAGR